MKLRTQEELLKYHKENNGLIYAMTDIDIICFMDFDIVKPFLKEGTTKNTWDNGRETYTLENVMKEMKDYLKFAFEKANGKRGLSAARSLQHYKNWFFLIGEDEMCKNINIGEYNYGLSKLEEIKKWLEEIKS